MQRWLEISPWRRKPTLGWTATPSKSVFYDIGCQAWWETDWQSGYSWRKNEKCLCPMEVLLPPYYSLNRNSFVYCHNVTKCNMDRHTVCNIMFWRSSEVCFYCSQGSLLCDNNTRNNIKSTIPFCSHKALKLRQYFSALSNDSSKEESYSSWKFMS